MKPAIYSKEYAAFEKEESFHKCQGGVHYYDFDEWYFQDDELEVSDLYDESYDYD